MSDGINEQGELVDHINCDWCGKAVKSTQVHVDENSQSTICRRCYKSNDVGESNRKIAVAIK